MLQRWVPLVALTTVCLSLVVHPALTRAADAEESPLPDELVNQATLADGLIAYGRTNKTPEALITAALILSKLPVADADATGQQGKPSAEHAREIASLLREAAGMRPEDALLKQLADRTRELTQEQSRDPFSQMREIMKRIRIEVARNQKKVVATVQKKKGENISASISQAGTLAINVGGSEGQTIAKARGTVTATAPRDGTYTIVLQAGTLAIDTTLSLR